MNLFGDESRPPETAETLEGLMGIEEGNGLLEGEGDETSDTWMISVAVTGGKEVITAVTAPPDSITAPDPREAMALGGISVLILDTMHHESSHGHFNRDMEQTTDTAGMSTADGVSSTKPMGKHENDGAGFPGN